MLAVLALKSRSILTLVIILSLILVLNTIALVSFPGNASCGPTTCSASLSSPLVNFSSLDLLSGYFVDFPLKYTDFGELGRRVQILRDWIENYPVGDDDLPLFIEKYAMSLFPFLGLSRHPPLSSLLRHHTDGSYGVVIPVGISNFRFASHLVGCIRNILKSTLPIEIAYGGEADLPLAYRMFLGSLGENIHIVDVSAVFDEEHLNLSRGGWAVKPFAILASKFQNAMLLDADSVLLQTPESIFMDSKAFRETGTLLFHDRLLFKNVYPERHVWWKSQMGHQIPSPAFKGSLGHSQKYSEEGESGLVMVDKGRLPVLLGLLHVAWQNTEEVRDQVTYTMGHGDKESWWFGFELCKVPYSFAPRYASVLGEAFYEATGTGGTRVCSFTIAHTDEQDRLLWFNGSLLKNKALNQTEYWVPDVWMKDGVWEKGRRKSSWSCQRDGEVLPVDEETKRILEMSVDEAKRMDDLIVQFL